MMGEAAYCDVSLPVPLDRPFTYLLPETLRHRVQPGCRLLVPFGARKLAGFVLRCHDEPPEGVAREALRLLDVEPALSAELLALGRWIADYYCAPLGEVLRSMAPFAGEVRRSRVYTLTDKGRDALRQLSLTGSAEDPAVQLMRTLEFRGLSAAYLATKLDRKSVV
jgi:primosomal protein N' (replication factor Y)